eukprot:197903-Pelagomonas_calceolata.AAC.1
MKERRPQLRELRQAEKEDRSSHKKESRMIADERVEFQTFISQQSQAQSSACQPRKAMPNSHLLSTT